MNLPNKLTIFRIFLVAVFMFFLFSKGVAMKSLALATFLAASFTDILDGYIAKKYNMVTDFGRLMDPIADKILVLAAFAVFVQMQLIDAWMFVIIVSREILITSLRLFALTKGKVLSAATAGKHKTVSQMSVIFLILIFIVLKEVRLTFFSWNPGWQKIFQKSIYFLMLFTVGLTLYSGLSYLWKNRKVIARF